MKNAKDRHILVLVESPNKCAHVLKFLKDAGYKNASVMASVGHIIELKDNRKSYKNSGIYPDEEFRLDLDVSEEKKDVVKKLKEQVRLADHIYLMTDGDREGEAIAWSLIKFLNLKPGTYSRAITHEITPKSVVSAIENPIELDEKLVDAAHARLTLDKLVGYALSPIARNYIGAKSVGRCQSAALKLIVDREKEIENFIPEKYYNLFLNFEKNGAKFKAKYFGYNDKEIKKIKTKPEVETIKQNCIGDYIIKDLIKKKRKESPRPPFTTATFQQAAANFLGLKVKDAMSIAQKLFENGYINYHRTDDDIFSNEFIDVLKPFVQNTFGKYVAPKTSKKQGNEQCGHECLRVINPSLTPEEFNKSNPNNLQQKVYALIWSRTIASVMPEAFIAETVYSIYNNGHKFILTSSELSSEGFRAVYKYGFSLGNTTTEKFYIGEILQNCTLTSEAESTKPAARYTEASLVKELQDRGIGRPSTFSNIIETVLSKTRGYTETNAGKISPTEKGKQLSDFLDRAFSSVISLDYTKELEENLDEIAKGSKTKLEFLNEFFLDLESSIKNNHELGIESTAEQKACPICGSPMKIRRNKFGKLFYGCTQYPNCHGLINI